MSGRVYATAAPATEFRNTMPRVSRRDGPGETMTVSVLMATIGRPTLERAIQSFRSQAMPGDQIVVIGATPDIERRAEALGCTFVAARPGNDWGGHERSVGIHHATGDYVSFMDDDDIYLPGARAAMAATMAAHPGQPTIFKMHIAWTGGYLWTEPVLKMGNVGTPMLFLPNDARTKSGKWGTVYGGDFAYIESLRLGTDTIVWDATPIASIRPKEGA
jgi:glycosyltransferase involved in cell wall biosynthesis